MDFILYDDLDPCCLNTGIVHFQGRYFGELWSICNARNLAVVADIHVHPGGAGQSQSDRDHPMIARVGHIALILPHFAARPIRRADIGIYRYQGAKKWLIMPSLWRRAFFHIGI